MSRLIWLSTLCALSSAANFPETWKKCKRNDPSTNACLDDAITKATVSLVPGNRALGILPIDPFHFEELRMIQGTGPIRLDITYSNLDLGGLSSVKFSNTKADWTNHKLKLHGEASIPITMIGDYKASGKYLLFDGTGQGKCNLTFYGFKFELELKGHEESVSGENHLVIDEAMMDPQPEKAHFYYSDFFNNNETLTNMVNTVINENWKTILDEMKPSVSQALGETIKQVSNRILSKIPYSELFE